MTFVYSFTSQSDKNLAIDAITAAYPGTPFPFGSGTPSGFMVSIPNVTQSEVDGVISGAIGKFVSADSSTPDPTDSGPSLGVPNPTLPGGSNTTDPLAGIAAWFKSLFSGLETGLIWIAVLAVVLLFALVFTHGAGEGVAARV